MMLRFALLVLSLFAVQVTQSVAQQEIGTATEAQVVLIDNVDLASRDGGIVVDVLVKAGQLVEKDELLIMLDHEYNELEVAIAQSELLIAEKARDNEADLDYANSTVGLAENELLAATATREKHPGIISDIEFARLDLAKKQAEFTVIQAEHAIATNELTASLRVEQLNMAKLSLRYRRIVAPIAGMIVEVEPQLGEWAPPGVKIARIVNLDRLRVVVMVPADLARKLRVGQTAEFSGQIGEEEFHLPATLTFVSPEIDPVNQDFKVWAEIDNTNRVLQPGIVGKLRFFQ